MFVRKLNFTRHRFIKRVIIQKFTAFNGGNITETAKNFTDQVTHMADNAFDTSIDKTIDKAILILNKVNNQMLASGYEGTQISVNMTMGPITVGITKTCSSTVNIE